ncbi:MAG: 7-carboxy-7-deazaguanine synthase QueE [Methanobacterium paludis]|nr:7-carboxy-7-deazaguanine synthase QueE [Methanobacterium paludis]
MLKIYYKVNNIYLSVEYVGINVGKPIIVIDLNGCSRNCNWCTHNDDSYFKNIINMNLEDIIYRISDYNTFNVKITGGEPTEQEHLYELVSTLKDFNYIVTIETNGDIDHKAFELADILIIDIKSYSASTSTTKYKHIQQVKKKYKKLILKGVIQNQADIDFYHSNFRNEDLWLFKEENKGRTELITERLLLNFNWRICFKTDRLVGLDFDTIYRKKYLKND